MDQSDTELEKDGGFEKTVRYTEEQLAEFNRIYDEEFTPAWENGGQYCRAGGGQYERSFAWWAWKEQQSKVDELQKRLDEAFKLLAQLNSLDDEACNRWKREACLFSHGESNAYEHATRLLEQALKGELNE